MIGRLALRSLTAHPVRSAVLAAGFGTGVAVMAILLGVAEVVLEQARSPAAGRRRRRGRQRRPAGVTAARCCCRARCNRPALRDRIRAASPRARGAAVSCARRTAPTPVDARGGIPSLERALGDPEDGRRDRLGRHAGRRRVDRARPGRRAARDRPVSIQSRTRRPGRIVGGVAVLQRPLGRRALLSDLPRRAPRGPTAHAAGRRSAAARSRRPDADRSARRRARRRRRARGAGSDHRRQSRPARRRCATASHARSARRRGGGAVEATCSSRRRRARLVPPIEIQGAGGWRIRLRGARDVRRARRDARASTAGAISARRRRGYHDHNWGFWEGRVVAMGTGAARRHVDPATAACFRRATPPIRIACPDSWPSSAPTDRSAMPQTSGSRRWMLRRARVRSGSPFEAGARPSI